jgi:putative hydrolase of the HAD superfamily
MAEALGVPGDRYTPVWNETLELRIIGAFQTVEANIEYVLNAMNEHARVEQIEKAVDIRMRSIGKVLEPKPDAINTLAQLKTRGFQLGLISNASIEIPMLWAETAFADLIDEPIFSSRVGMKKPDVRIYQLACERLGARPETCLYIGDGEDHELSGAAQIGLNPVLIRASTKQNTSPSHREANEWQGPTIARLPEVLQLV